MQTASRPESIGWIAARKYAVTLGTLPPATEMRSHLGKATQDARHHPVPIPVVKRHRNRARMWSRWGGSDGGTCERRLQEDEDCAADQWLAAVGVAQVPPPPLRVTVHCIF